MKKVTFALALITLVQFTTWAQPVATSANVTDFTGEFYFAEATNFSPGPAGANQTWDFSNLQLTLAGIDTPVPVAQTPFAASFPTANNCYKFSGIFPPDRYYYQNVSATKYEIIGLAITATTGDNYTPNPRTFAVFPYTYNTVYTDTYRTVADPTEVTFTATYDAYGTLVLPFGTYQNVIRQKVVKNGQTNYNWFHVAPFFPILQTVLEQNSLGLVKNLTPLGVTGNEFGKMFAVYPNPTNGEINIETTGTVNNPVEIEIFDMLGKRIIYRKEENLSDDQIQLNLESHTAGIYLLKVTDVATHASYTQKIIKK